MEPTPVSLWTPGGPRASSLSVAGMYQSATCKQREGESQGAVFQKAIWDLSQLWGAGERSMNLLFCSLREEVGRGRGTR